MRKILGTLTGVTAAMLVVGVAWAGGDRADSGLGAALNVSAGAEAGAQAETGSTSVTGSSSTSVTGSSSTSVTGSSSTSVTGNSSTSVIGNSSTTATTAPGSSTSTSTNGSTSTTIKEDFTSSSGGTFIVASGVSVTVEIRAGILVVTDVSAPGWSVEIKDMQHDRVSFEFHKAGSSARFEAKLDGGRIEIKIRQS